MAAASKLQSRQRWENARGDGNHPPPKPTKPESSNITFNFRVGWRTTTNKR